MDVSQYNEHDQVIWDEELSDFVPDRVFDAHIHLFNSAHYPPGNAAWSDQGLADIQPRQCLAQFTARDFVTPIMVNLVCAAARPCG